MSKRNSRSKKNLESDSQRGITTTRTHRNLLSNRLFRASVVTDPITRRIDANKSVQKFRNAVSKTEEPIRIYKKFTTMPSTREAYEHLHRRI